MEFINIGQCIYGVGGKEAGMWWVVAKVKNGIMVEFIIRVAT